MPDVNSQGAPYKRGRPRRTARMTTAGRATEPSPEEAWQAALRHDFVVRLLENRLDFGVMVPVIEIGSPKAAIEVPSDA